eukprot:m.43726 g.43726  ORF g.43726 m.43726 type:complete len:938 (+) comp33471_c0_seq1:246-3059(+)
MTSLESMSKARNPSLRSPALVAAAAGVQFLTSQSEPAQISPSSSVSVDASKWLRQFQEMCESQKRQQESLLDRQQRQIEELKREQERVQAQLERQKQLRTRRDPPNSHESKEEASGEWILQEKEDEEENGLEKVDCDVDVVPLAASRDERPIRPALRTDVQSFDEFVMTQIQLERQGGLRLASTPSKPAGRTFLKKGEGLARFVGARKKVDQLVNDPEEEQTEKSNPLSVLLSSDEEGSEVSEESIPESSFQVRSKQRLKSEKEELDEFEMLEQAAGETSFSSQCSLVQAVISRAAASGDQQRKEERPFQPGQPPTSENKDGSHESVSEASLSDPGDSTLLDNSDNEKTLCFTPGHALDFDDQDAWDDEERETEAQTQNGRPVSFSQLPFSVKRTQRKVYHPPSQGSSLSESLKEASEESSLGCDDSDDNSDDSMFRAPGSVGESPVAAHKMASSPPTSSLMAQLFPALQKKKDVRQVPVAQTGNLPVGNERVMGTKGASLRDRGQEDPSTGAFRDKLTDLEKEIKRFKAENAAVAKIREEREKEFCALQKERSDFQSWKEKEMAEFESYKDAEARKLRKEKQVFEQHRASLQNKPDKQEREEIAGLKKEVEDVQSELSRRELRWNAAGERYRAKIGILEKENKELKEELRVMEEQRLQNWMQTLEGAEILSKRKASPAERERGGKKATTGTSKPTSTSKSKAEAKSAVKSEKKAVHFSDDGTLSSSDGNEKKRSLLESPKKLKTIRHPGGKVEEIRPDGSRLITFPDGTKKEVSADGLSAIVSFGNGDIRHIFPDQKVVYFYSETKTKHTTYPDGLEVLEFESGQVEKHYPDGTKEIIFIDQTVKYLFSDSSTESLYPDGTVERVAINGDKTIEFTNGQKEVHTTKYKKREYPDGTVKTVFNDGRQETRYSSGRVRIKDPSGNIVADSLFSEKNKP